MPMWKIYHPEHTLSPEDKQQIAQKVTAMYSSFLPKFYVNVFFEELTAIFLQRLLMIRSSQEYNLLLTEKVKWIFGLT